MLPSQPTKPALELPSLHKPVRRAQPQVTRKHHQYRQVESIQHPSKIRPRLDPLLVPATIPIATPPMAPRDIHHPQTPPVLAKIASPTAPRPFLNLTPPTPQPAVKVSIKHPPRSPPQQEASNRPQPLPTATAAAPAP